MAFVSQKSLNLNHNKQFSYGLSYWEKASFFEPFDFLVIGGGIVGLSAALSAKTLAPQARVALFERGPLPIGASTRNAGFACFGSASELVEDIEKYGEEAVFDLVAKRWQGLQRLRARLGDAHLDYNNWGGYELFRTDDDELFEKCMDWLPVLNRKLGAITNEREVYSPVDHKIRDYGFAGVKHLLLNKCEGQLNTGAMMSRLIQLAHQANVLIYNGVEVTNWAEQGEEVEIETQFSWKVKAHKVLFTTNGFARQHFPHLDVQPARNQVLVTRPLPKLKFKGCFHYDRGYYYFRNIDGRILLGGGRNLAPDSEQTDQFETTPLIQNALRQLLKDVIVPGQEVEVDYWWSGILGVGKPKKPIIEKVSPRVALAVRLGGMGVAIGTLVGEEGAELLMS
jgi:gamma-glutamylputrescine oxidase